MKFPQSRRHLGILLCLVVFPWGVCQASKDDFSLLGDDESMSFDAMAAPSDPGASHWQLALFPSYDVLSSGNYDGIKYSDGIGIGGSLFYRLSPWWQLGVEGGYSFNHEYNQDLFILYGYPFRLQNSIHIAHIIPSIEVGRWRQGIKPWRLYANAGSGWYQINEKLDFRIDANQFLYQEQLAERTDDYLGAQMGIGLDCEVYPQGIVGLQVNYQRIFMPGGDIVIFSPTLRLSYRY